MTRRHPRLLAANLEPSSLSAQPRPNKRARLEETSSAAIAPSLDAGLPFPNTSPSLTMLEENTTIEHAPEGTITTAFVEPFRKTAAEKPFKRTRHDGTLRRLALSRPKNKAVRQKSTLGGSKIGGKSKDLRPNGREGTEVEMWITRKKMCFSAYLKLGVAAFLQDGATVLTLHSIGAAIPLALTLGLAIRDALPGGNQSKKTVSQPESAFQAQSSCVNLEVRTGSIMVTDEIVPADDEQDLIYQTRNKSTVKVQLSTKESLVKGGLGGTTLSRGIRRRRGRTGK